MQAPNSSVFKPRRARQKLFQCVAHAQQLGRVRRGVVARVVDAKKVQLAEAGAQLGELYGGVGRAA